MDESGRLPPPAFDIEVLMTRGVFKGLMSVAVAALLLVPAFADRTPLDQSAVTPFVGIGIDWTFWSTLSLEAEAGPFCGVYPGFGFGPYLAFSLMAGF